MSDKKLTDNEIIKALECCCGIEHDCDKCPYEENNECGELNGILKDALDLINRLQAENKRLNEEAKTIRAYIHHNGLEWDLLSYSKIKTTDWLIKGISKKQLEQEKIQAWKTEAYKECIEKAKAKATDIGVCDAQGNNYGGATVVFVNELDNLLKGLVGEDKDGGC